jgi:ATP-dependent DNA ligase
MTYEPADVWCIARDGDEVELASRGGKMMTRYFPRWSSRRR